MLKLYVDARCLQDPNYSKRGVGRHTRGILKYAHDYFNKSISLIGYVDLFSLPSLSNSDVKLFDTTCNTFGEVTTSADIFLSPFALISNQSEFLNVLSSNSIFSACLFYDLIPLFNQDKYLTNAFEKSNYNTSLSRLNLYDLIIAISKATELELQSSICFSRPTFSVSGVGISEDLIKSKRGTKPNNMQLAEKYFMMVGGGDNRKRVDTALRAFALVQQGTDFPLSFALVGNFPSDQLNEFKKIIKKNNIIKNVSFFSNLYDSELAYLYSHAMANICPSSAEGFFVPLVEGIALGCPAIASDIPPQRELLGGDSNLLFPVDDHSKLAKIMLTMLDKEKRSNALKKHLHLAKDFSERNVAKRVWSAIRDNYRKKNEKSLKKHAQSNNSKPYFAIITPISPDQSGCARYSEATITELSKYVKLDVFTDAVGFTRHSQVLNYGSISALPHLSGKYDEVISIIGNSHFHTKIYDFALNYGGVVIEHDNRLLDFINWKYGSVIAAKLATLETGREVDAQMINYWLHNTDQIKALFLNQIFDASKQFFMHSKPLISTFQNKTGRKSKYLPFSMYNNFNLTDKQKLRNFSRNKLGLKNNDFCVITLGSVDPTKYCQEIAHAAVHLTKTATMVKFYFVGHCPAGQFELMQKIIGKNDQIFLEREKYLTETEYSEYLYAADFGIQLRKHKLGGLSGGLMDSITTGLPTVANNDLALAMDAPKYVKIIPDNPSVNDIYNSLSFIVQTNIKKGEIEKQLKQYLNNHNFQVYCKSLLTQLGYNL